MTTEDFETLVKSRIGAGIRDCLVQTSKAGTATRRVRVISISNNPGIRIWERFNSCKTSVVPCSDLEYIETDDTFLVLKTRFEYAGDSYIKIEL